MLPSILGIKGFLRWWPSRAESEEPGTATFLETGPTAGTDGISARGKVAGRVHHSPMPMPELSSTANLGGLKDADSLCLFPGKKTCPGAS